MARAKKGSNRFKLPTVEQAVFSLLGFCRRYLSHLCQKRFAPMHQEWNEDIVEHRFNNFQAHRESAKSTILAIGYPLWRMCVWLYYRSRGANVNDEHIALLGATDDDAIARLRQSRHELETNTLIKKDFNPMRGPVWTDDQFILAGARDVKNPTLQASGLVTFVPGPRLTAAVLDDTTNKFHVESAAQRNKQHNALLEVVEPMLLDEAPIIAIHTQYHNDDLPNRLKKDERFNSKQWPLVIDEERKTVQWPEVWPWRRVEEKKKSPLVFARQYQLKDIAVEDRLLPMPDYYDVRSVSWQAGQLSILGKPCRIYSACDPATSEKQRKGGSRTTIITAAVDSERNIYILEARGGYYGIDKSIDEMEAAWGMWRSLTFWIEAVNFSGIYSRLLSKKGIPARPSPAKGDKMQRLTGTLNPQMANHKIRYPDNAASDDRVDQMAVMIAEHIEFPGETMDFIDGLEHLVRNVDTNVVAAAPSGDVIKNARRKLKGTRRGSWLKTKWD